MRAAESGVLAGVLAGAILVGPGGLGTPGHAQPAPDVERAKDLYTSAEAASAATTPAAGSAAAAPRLGRHKGPWLLVGGSIAFVTMGAVLAYSADAAERDVEDLYVGLNGTPPPFNDTTRKRYDDAIAEGRRYQTLSIASFGVAGAMAIGAAVWFALDKDGGEKLTVTPAVAPGTAGVSTTIRF